MTTFNTTSKTSYEATSLAIRELYNNSALRTPDSWNKQDRLLAIGAICERRFTYEHRLQQTLDAQVPDCTLTANDFIQWAEQAELIEVAGTSRIDGRTATKYQRTSRFTTLLAFCEDKLDKRIKFYIKGSALTEAVVNTLNGQQLAINPTVQQWAREMFVSKKYRHLLTKEFEADLRVIINQNRPFNEAYKLDHRGRIYVHGTQLRHDGGKHIRSAIERATPTAPSDLPKALDAISLQIADELGSKESMRARIKIGAKYAEHTTVDANFWFDSPVLGNLVRGYHELKTTGKTAIMVYQDATSSGIQHMAAIMRSRRLANKVNICPATADDAVKDVYKMVADAMGVSRKTAKKCMMPRIYGAGDESVADSFYERSVAEGMTPQQAELHTREVMVKYFEAESRQIPEILAFSKAMQNAGAVEGRMSWTMPDGFRVIQEEKDTEACSVRVGRYHTYTKDKAKVSASLQASAFPPNFVHSIDAYMLRRVIAAAGMEMLPIHDSIGVAPENYFKLNEVIRKEFHATHKQIDAESMVKEATGKAVVLPYTGDYNIDESLDALNMFC